MKESEHSRTPEAIHASENGLRLVIDNIPGFVWTDTASGEIELINQPYLDYLGKTLDEAKDWPRPYTLTTAPGCKWSGVTR